MKKVNYLFLIAIFIIATALKSDKPAYKLFDDKGKEVKYKKLVKDALEADIIMFGELHNNPISHWLQLQLTEDIFAEKGAGLVLAAEMFEADNQLLLDEYLTGVVKQKSFEDEAKLWPNYKTDYKPLVEFAKENQLKFVASNIPRRYASVVHKKGFEGLDSLDNAAKAYIAPLPPEYDPTLPGYAVMMEMMSGMGKGHANANLPKAQAIKDATMAYFTFANWEPGKLVIHYNGAYHSDNFEGTVWYLKRLNPELKILTITTVQQDDIEKLSEDNTGVANYTICVPSDMTTTY
ncbi:MAG: iron-regulated protein [Bacteroidetes bacterium 4484_249]|nr:MAG: iron-regulated protein [Bacteroidetes bacterium 4484_249]